MTISWYSISILPQSGAGIFYGYFSVDNTTNLVTGFYDLSLPTGSSYTNVILPLNSPAAWTSPADNIYPFQVPGLNFYSTALQTFFSIGQNNFNLFYDPVEFPTDRLATTATNTFFNPPYPAYTINYAPISGPPSPIVCFKENTQILTDKGYVQIQDLRQGDLVKTLKHDFKPIDMIGKREIYHPAIQERINDQLYKCSQSEYSEVFEDLVITGCHSILVDNFSSEEQKERVIEVNGDTYVTDRKYRLPACADPRASVYETAGTYTIYHFALEHNDYYMNYGIYANGLLVETCSKRILKEMSNMTFIE
jgi:hypothetical protein